MTRSTLSARLDEQMDAHTAVSAEPDLTARRAAFEARMRAREERSEYGRTVGDLRRLLKRARYVQVIVRITDAQWGNQAFMQMTRDGTRKAIRFMGDDERMPCEFDPEDKSLVIGSLRAIDKAKQP